MGASTPPQPCRTRELIRLGFAEDVADAARLDAYPVLPTFHDRRVTLAAVRGMTAPGTDAPTPPPEGSRGGDSAR